MKLYRAQFQGPCGLVGIDQLFFLWRCRSVRRWRPCLKYRPFPRPRTHSCRVQDRTFDGESRTYYSGCGHRALRDGEGFSALDGDRSRAQLEECRPARPGDPTSKPPRRHCPGKRTWGFALQKKVNTLYTPDYGALRQSHYGRRWTLDDISRMFSVHTSSITRNGFTGSSE